MASIAHSINGYMIPGVFYGTCSTSASTQAKAVTISGITELYAGLCISVKFTYAQSYSGTPTINLNSLGAKSIHHISGTAAGQYEWNAGAVLDFMYDGSYWVIVGNGHATTTYYGVTKLSDSVSSTSSSMAATPYAVYQAYSLASGKSTKATYTGTLSSSSWSSASSGGYTLTLSISGILSTDTPVIGPVMTGTYATDKAMLEAWGNVSRITTASGSITCYAYDTAPAVNIPIQLMCMR